jgi:hypothetical protein
MGWVVNRGFAMVLFLVLFAAAMADSALAARVIFVPRTIGTTGGSAGDVAAVDFDGDGDVDVVAAWFSRVVWYEQRGRPQHPVFIEHTIASSVNFATSVYVEDLDGDADMDVLVSSLQDNKIAWFENGGGGSGAFQQHVISTQALEARSVHAADIDRDGDIDVLSASVMDDKVSWYESDGGSPPLFTEHVITEDPDGPFKDLEGPADGAWYVGAADLDSDGDQDVLVGAAWADEMIWFENSGTVPVGFTLHIAGMGGGGNPAVHAADIDGDGNVDLVATSGGGTVWFKNDGGTPPSFELFFAGSSLWDAWDVVTGDIDGDGDVDIVAVSSYEDKIIWDENLGGTPTAFREHVITQDPDGIGWGRDGFADWVISVFVEDLDLDGDQDVLFGAAAGLVGWFENVKVIEGKAKSKGGNN